MPQNLRAGKELWAVDSLLENNYYNVKMDIVNKDGPTLKMMWKMYLNKNREFKILDHRWSKYASYTTSRILSVIKNNPEGVKGLISAMDEKSSGS